MPAATQPAKSFTVPWMTLAQLDAVTDRLSGWEERDGHHHLGTRIALARPAAPTNGLRPEADVRIVQATTNQISTAIN
jgi:hypothetical protein